MLFPCSPQRSRSIRSSSWSNRTADSSRPKEQSADAPLPRQGLRGDSLADALQILTLILIHIGKIKNRPLCTVPPSQISDSRLRRGLPHSPFAPSMILCPPVDFNGEGAIAFGSKRGMQPWNHFVVSYRPMCAHAVFARPLYPRCGQKIRQKPLLLFQCPLPGANLRLQDVDLLSDVRSQLGDRQYRRLDVMTDGAGLLWPAGRTSPS